MVRSDISRRSGASIGIYIVMLRQYMGQLTAPFECKLKEAVGANGGDINQSGLFLGVNSLANVVSRRTGINRRSVMYIPRNKVPVDILKCIDKREY